MQATIVLALACVFAAASQASYIDYEALEAAESDYSPYNEKTPYGVQAKREACVTRGGSCDHSASDCCANTVCRCNLWGANCKCTRKSLFSLTK